MIGVITAGGRGTRILPYSPKETFLFGNKAVIVHCVENLKDCGIRDIVVIVGEGKDEVMKCLRSGKPWGVRIHYEYQDAPNGLGDAVSYAEYSVKCSGHPFFALLLGDNVFSPVTSFKQMIQNHKENYFASLLVEKTQTPEKYGVVKFSSDFNGKSGQVIDIIEKPNKQERRGFDVDGVFYAISGAYVFNNRIFGFLSKPESFNERLGEKDLTKAIQLGIQEGLPVFAQVLEGKRYDLGNPLGALSAQRDLFHNLSDEKMKLMAEFWENKLRF